MEEINEEKLRFQAFWQQVMREFQVGIVGSDRTGVILFAAKIDELLRDILESLLFPAASRNRKDDELLADDRPLGSFSARIKACARLGVLESDFVRALHLVRQIRNDFAHDLAHQNEPLSLRSGPSADRLRELSSIFNKHDHDWPSTGIDGKPLTIPPAVVFVRCGLIMVNRLGEVLMKSQRVQPWLTGHLRPDPKPNPTKEPPPRPSS